mmetsp:Transcript_890/g.3036  ORF Transcript_890/g.3036 Transcript_890/m.3036 type:complete len:233 (+) Transcript_890:54-752(+)
MGTRRLQLVNVRDAGRQLAHPLEEGDGGVEPPLGLLDAGGLVHAERLAVGLGVEQRRHAVVHDVAADDVLDPARVHRCPLVQHVVLEDGTRTLDGDERVHHVLARDALDAPRRSVLGQHLTLVAGHDRRLAAAADGVQVDEHRVQAAPVEVLDRRPVDVRGEVPAGAVLGEEQVLAQPRRLPHALGIPLEVVGVRFLVEDHAPRDVRPQPLPQRLRQLRQVHLDRVGGAEST